MFSAEFRRFRIADDQLRTVSCVLFFLCVVFTDLVISTHLMSAAPAYTPTQATSSDIKPSQNAPSQRPYSESISKVLEDAERVFKIIAILVAGVWAYFNFFRGRTYRPRLEPSVSGTAGFNKEGAWVVASLKVKNIGLSHIIIQHQGSALQVFTTQAHGEIARAQETDWKRMAVFDVFTKHGWIEPGELLQEERFIAIPEGKYVAFRFDLRVVSTTLIRNKWMEKKKPPEWNATTIVTLQQQPQGIVLLPHQLQGKEPL